MSHKKIPHFVIATTFLTATVFNPAMLYRNQNPIETALGADAPAPPSSMPPYSTPESIRVQSCEDVYKDYSKALTDFRSACKSAVQLDLKADGSKNKDAKLALSDDQILKACQKKLDDCSKNQDEEQASDVSQLGTDFLNQTGQSQYNDLFTTIAGSTDDMIRCPVYSDKDYKDAIDKAQKDLKEAQKTVDDKKKLLTDLQKDMPEKLGKLKTEMVVDKQKYNETVAADKEKARNEVASVKQQMVQMQDDIRTIQGQILAERAKQIELVGNRKIKVDGYKIELIGCKNAALQKRAEMKKGANTVSSLSSASSQGGGAASDLNTMYYACVRQVLQKRQNEGDIYKEQMAQLDIQLKQYEQRMSEKQEAVQLLTKQANEAAADRAAKSYNNAQSYNQNLAIKSDQLNQMSQQFQQQQNELSEDVAKAEAELNKKSNELNKTKNKKPKAGAEDNIIQITKKIESFEALKMRKEECDKQQAAKAKGGSGGSTSTDSPGAAH